MNLLAAIICVLVVGAFGDIATTPEDEEDAGIYDFQKYFFSSPRSGRSFEAEPKVSHFVHQVQQSGEDVPHFGREVSQSGQNVPHFGRKVSQSVQDVPHFGREVSQSGQDLPHFGKDASQSGQNVPHFGQEISRSEADMPRFGKGVSHFGQDDFEEVEEVNNNNETEEVDGRLFPGAPSFIARLAFRVLLWKILRAAAQYFVDIIVAELFG